MTDPVTWGIWSGKPFPTDVAGDEHTLGMTKSLVTVVSLGGGGVDRLWWHHPGGWHPNWINFLWVNLQRTLDKRCCWKAERLAVVRRRQLTKGDGRFERTTTKKIVVYLRKERWHHQLPHRMTPRLVTSLTSVITGKTRQAFISLWQPRSWIGKIRQIYM